MKNNKANYFVCSFVFKKKKKKKKNIDQQIKIGSSVPLGIPCPDHQL